MIFSTDLDGTIIYSSRYLTDKNKDKVLSIEQLEGETISYISKKSYKLIEELNKKMLFIPVTTRTYEQYMRISIFQNYSPKYAITTSGAKILYNGKLIKEWTKRIDSKYKELKINADDIFKVVTNLLDEKAILKYRYSDKYFWTFILDMDKFDKNIYPSIQKNLLNSGWSTSLQGRKLYIIPKFIDKWEAVKYICERENIDFVISAGDTYLDSSMIVNSDVGIIPRHSQLNNKIKSERENNNIYETEEFGILAGEEILLYVYDEWKKYKSTS